MGWKNARASASPAILSQPSDKVLTVTVALVRGAVALQAVSICSMKPGLDGATLTCFFGNTCVPVPCRDAVCTLFLSQHHSQVYNDQPVFLLLSFLTAGRTGVGTAKLSLCFATLWPVLCLFGSMRRRYSIVQHGQEKCKPQLLLRASEVVSFPVCMGAYSKLTHWQCRQDFAAKKCVQLASSGQPQPLYA